MGKLSTWLITALFFAALGAFSTWLFLHGEAEHEEHEEKATATASASEAEEGPAVTRDSTGAVVVKMEEETQQRVGLQIQPVQETTDQPQLTAYGSLQENPAASFTLRAPVAGTVVTSSDWPIMGKELKPGTEVGGLTPRLGPVERIDLQSKLATAYADVEDARASLVALRSSLESKRQLNTGGQKIISEQILQEAEAKVKSEDARLRAAQETVKTLESSISATSKPEDTIPLVVARAGRVVEVLAHPGEAVESGQALLRLSDFSHMLARVALPAGQSASKLESATITVSGHSNYPITVQDSSLAPSVDPVTGGQTFLFNLSTDSMDLQPGLPVSAQLSLPGDQIKGVVVPPGAIIRYVGAGWVYVKTGEETFVRREVPLNRSTAKGWFVAQDLEPGTPVVVQAAQTLLSQELKFQQGGGGEEEE